MVTINKQIIIINKQIQNSQQSKAISSFVVLKTELYHTSPNAIENFSTQKVSLSGAQIGAN